MNVIEVVAQESGEPGAVLPHAAEIIVGFVAFAVLVYIVGRYAWPLFTKSHEDHRSRISGGIRQAESEQERAQEELERNRAKLAQADTEAARIRDDARGDAERIKEDMAERAREEADRILAQGRQSLDASRSRTVSDLRGEVGRQSVELAGRIVGSALSDESSRSASVDGFLDQLERMAGDDGSGSDDGAARRRPSPAGATRLDAGTSTGEQA